MATFALLTWPLVALVIFSRIGVPRGLIWSVLVGYLFLPESYTIDLPGLPPYGKFAAVAVGALLGVLVFRGRETHAPPPQLRSAFPAIMIGLLALLVLSPVGTWVTNLEPVVNGQVVRPSMRFPDLRAMVSALVMIFIPFVLAYWYITRPEHHRELLVALVVLGLFYSLLVLFEARMSPQLHIWTYGYFQHQWLQHERGGAFRPLVFLRHGLWLGFFLFTVAMAALVLSRVKGPRSTQYLVAAGWILAVLLLSRNLGATALGLLVAPLILMFGPQAKLRLAACMAAFFLTYPVIMSSGLSPAPRILEWVTPLAPERAASFGFRLSNEERLLDRAMEKPVFGWGIWGRSRVFNERGVDISVTDGIWIIALGERGWAGYIAQFSLLTMPIFFLLAVGRRRQTSPEIAGMALIMGANCLYMIPNSTLSPIGMIMAGTLAASVRFGSESADAAAEPASAPADDRPRGPGYARRLDPNADPRASSGPRYTRF